MTEPTELIALSDERVRKLTDGLVGFMAERTRRGESDDERVSLLVRTTRALEAQLAENARLQAVIDEAEKRIRGAIQRADVNQLHGRETRALLRDVTQDAFAAAGYSSALEAVKADTTTEEAEAVARLTHIIAGWDYENPEDGSEEDVKYIRLEATAYVEAARLARSGSSATVAARHAADLIPRDGLVETEGERRG